MKHLGDFNYFDWTGFAKDKKFQVVSVNPWKDTNGRFQGTKVEVVIMEDHTKYVLRQGETAVTNAFEKLIFKVEGDQLLEVAVGSIVEALEVKATIYGDYRNNLSVKCKDVMTITGNGSGAHDEVKKK